MAKGKKGESSSLDKKKRRKHDPTAPSGGITKHKRGKAKAEPAEGLDGKPNKKKKRIADAQERRRLKTLKVTYYAVQVGRVPGVYTSVERYRAQIKGFSNAVSQKFTNEKQAQNFVAAGADYFEEDDIPAHGGAAAVSGIRFDAPRGLALGMAREGGRIVLKNRPTFSVLGATPVYLPDNSAPAPAPPSPGGFGLEGPSTGDRGEAEEASAQGDILPGLDDDFVALGGSTAAAAERAQTPEGTTVEAKTEWSEHELPWYRANMRIGSPSLRLHNEIVELTALLRPTAQEDAQRVEARDLLSSVVFDVFPGSRLDIFGSFATGLHLPTSDVDCVILGTDVPDARVGTALQGLGKKLTGLPWVRDLEVVAKAKVPIVKLVIMPFGLKFDISLGKSNGLAAVTLIRSHLAAWPALRPLVTILKLYLLQRNMNEVYSGGLGSFALISTAIAFLKLHQSRTRGLAGQPSSADAAPLEQNLGLLLIDYFRFYGRALRYQAVGVSAADGGFCYDKEKAGFGRQERDKGDRFSVMDPLDSSNDVARGTFNAHLVRSSFDHAYNLLTAPCAHRGRPMLGLILRLNEVLAIRPPPTPAVQA